MNIILWVLQILLGLYFLMIGAIHFILPAGLPEAMAWMYDLSPWLHWFSGAVEILGGIGLILPGLVKIQTRLTPLAALGLTLVMVGAIVYHLTRGETQNILLNVILAGLCFFIYYGRTRMHPLTDRTASA